MKDTIYYIYQKYFQRNILQSFQTFFSTILFLQNTIFNINKLCRIKRPENDSCILARFSNGNAVVGRKCLLATCCRAHGTWRVCVPRASYVVILHFAPCICHERVSLRRPFEYASTPLSFIIHYFAVFIAPIGYYGIYIYIRYRSAEFPRLISTTLGSEEEERRWKSDAVYESYLEISMDGNLIFFSLSSRASLFHPVKLSRPLFNCGSNENKAG